MSDGIVPPPEAQPLPRVALRPYRDEDAWLQTALDAPEMTEHLGGPQGAASVAARHARYLRLVESDEAAVCVVLVDGEVAGGVNVWPDHRWYEMGWSTLPAFQGRGVARAAVLLGLERARTMGGFDTVRAYPRLSNVASNAVARSAGFRRLGIEDVEYPRGVRAPSVVWQYRLR